MSNLSSTPAQTCGQSYTAGLKNDDKAVLLNIHNELRQKVASGKEEKGNPGPQPAAVKMPNLSWDNELEMIAQRWANQCNVGHDECRNVDRFAVGQNIWEGSYLGTKSPFTWQNAVQSWYNEVAKFNKNGVSSYKFDWNTGHYTQVIWADTTKIGCGQINYKKPNGWNTQLVVCNYGPSGNVIGQKIYEKK